MNLAEVTERIDQASDILRVDNDSQQRDIEQHEAECLQALMTVAAAGLTEQADTLALGCGLWRLWKAPIKAKRIAIDTWP